MIKLENVSFSYGSREVLKNVSAEFRRGEITCVVGVNGSGKSTLLRLLARIRKPDSGMVTLYGQDVRSYTRRDFSRNVAFLPQAREVPPVNLYDFVSHGRYPYLGFSGKMTDKDIEAVKCALKVTELSALSERRLPELSGGERQRAYIAMVMAQNSQFVLLDEPTTYLDISHSFDTMRLLSAMRSAGKGIVAVMHDLPLALKYADRILIIDKDSRKCEAMTPDEAAYSGILDKAFGVKTGTICIDEKTEYYFTEA